MFSGLFSGLFTIVSCFGVSFSTESLVPVLLVLEDSFVELDSFELDSFDEVDSPVFVVLLVLDSACAASSRSRAAFAASFAAAIRACSA